MEFIDLKAQYRALKPKIDANIQAVLNAGQFIGGPYVKALEEKLCAYVAGSTASPAATAPTPFRRPIWPWAWGGRCRLLPGLHLYRLGGARLYAGCHPGVLRCVHGQL